MNPSETLCFFAMKNREKDGEEMADFKELLMGELEPPLMELSPLRLGGSSRKRGMGEREGNTEKYETKILNEQKKRQKISESFSVLQSLLPRLCFLTKVTREQVLTGTIDFIKQLEEEKNRLENLKKLLLQDLAKLVSSHYTNGASSTVNLTISNGVAFFVIEFQVKHGFLYNVFMVFEKYQAEVLVANVSVVGRGLVTLTVTVLVGSGTRMVEDIKKELQNL